jgi:mono/diheme cytochrome c family protein
MRRTVLLLLASALVALSSATGAVAADGRDAVTTAQSAAPDVAKGKAVYALWCLDCHAPLTGMGMFPPAGSYRLQERYKGTVPAVLRDRSDLTAEFIRLTVRRGMNMMPATRKTEVTDAELDSVIAYLTQKAPK